MAAGSQAQGLGGAQRSLPLSPLLLGREPESCVPTERRAVLPLPSPQPWRTADQPVSPTPPPAVCTWILDEAAGTKRALTPARRPPADPHRGRSPGLHGL